MPFYEYRCQSCGHKFDVLQKISDEPLKDCPECLKPELIKLVSAPSFRLAGSGWYETDFKTDKDKKKNLVESKADTKGDSSEKKTGADSGKKESPSKGSAGKKESNSAGNNAGGSKPGPTAA